MASRAVRTSLFDAMKAGVSTADGNVIASLLLFAVSTMRASFRFFCWRRRNRKLIFGLLLLFLLFCVNFNRQSPLVVTNNDVPLEVN